MINVTIDINDCTNLNPNNYNMNILQLNIRSLLVHQYELKLLLQQLNNKNSAIDIVAFCETFLTKRVEKVVNIPGYTLHSNNCNEHKGGGVDLLIRNGTCYKMRKDLEEFVKKESAHIFQNNE